MARRWVTKEELKNNLKEGFLGTIELPKKETSENEEYSKVTILLPKDTVDMIDQMINNAGVSSRGRLIQLLVDDIWSLRGDYNDIDTAIAAWRQKKLSESELLLSLTLGLGSIQRKLLRYYGESSAN